MVQERSSVLTILPMKTRIFLAANILWLNPDMLQTLAESFTFFVLHHVQISVSQCYKSSFSIARKKDMEKDNDQLLFHELLHI